MEIENLHYEKTINNYLDYLPIINEEISYNDFYKNYLIKNQACVIKNVANNWNSYKYWSANNKISFNYLLSKYSDLDVIVYNCGEKYYNSQKTHNCTFHDYVKYWKDLKNEPDGEKSLLYLKDWHLQNYCLENDGFYEVPKYFLSDWLNEYLSDNNQDDYRFVYMGPKGTWTPFHADVFMSYSWSTNICGQKKWLLFPPGEENGLKDSLGNLPYNINNIKHNQKYFEIIQDACDAIFVPSGWYHQVFNLSDTISINHNWINACNLHIVYENMVKNLEQIKVEIDDCRDMLDFLEHCQLMLNVTFGMNFKNFFDLLTYITDKRLNNLKTIENASNNFQINRNHVVYDLESICYILKLFVRHEDVQALYQKDVFDPEHLLNKIYVGMKKI